jgi:exonuclease III
MADTNNHGKARILMGDLNVVNRDSDISGSPAFWKGQGDQSVEDLEEPRRMSEGGLPGCWIRDL